MLVRSGDEIIVTYILNYLLSNLTLSDIQDTHSLAQFSKLWNCVRQQIYTYF